MLAASGFLASYTATGLVPHLEAAALQVRKALETIAFSAVAPDKKQYAAFRATATNCPDFTKDYHAAKIFATLARINKDFYPVALAPAQRQADGSYHFGNRQSGYLTKKKFESVYDRLGKHLHAHNPWSGNKNLQILAKDLPAVVEDAHSLLDLHARFIRTPDFHGVWVVETDRSGNPPKVITANAAGPYVVGS